MTKKLLKLYRLISAPHPGFGEVASAVVYACSPADALAALAEAFDGYPRVTMPGYAGAPCNPYSVVEEVPFERGVVLAEGQDG